MTYIITLTQKQFITLYNHVLDHYLDEGILEAMELSKSHYKERETVLRELLGITIEQAGSPRL